ncbi:MAG: hypothetical protein O9253_02195, partial [Aquidulcibacter sp.]|nr:hypothetical protein [Aquidulcibacter sp.]
MLPFLGDALTWLENCLRRRVPPFFEFKGPSCRFAPARAKPLCATRSVSAPRLVPDAVTPRRHRDPRTGTPTDGTASDQT